MTEGTRLRWARAGLWGGLALFVLFGALLAAGLTRWYDLPIDRWILHNVPPPKQVPPPGQLGYLSIWGSQYATVPVTVATVMGLLGMGAVRQAKIVSAVGFTGGLLILGFQRVFEPLLAWWGPASGAQVVYPSGHEAGAAMAWGFAAFFLPLAGRPAQRWVRPLLWSVWGALCLGIALDRLLVRSHILSDLVGGWGLGVAMLSLAVLLDRAGPGAPREDA
ncbi:MAG TPA: phosphatase PAP2 family protein [Candidatus Thermoplasmatota archaeon]|nr:phosphatase PAP2 family protein [Candidatus Thermoplasmatota archaeon]